MVVLLGGGREALTSRHDRDAVRGDAGGMQVEGAKLGGVYDMGGTRIASYVSILEPLR